ncbi:MAG: error-prone DNA polymerase, partial [Acidobacteriota bacterium]|nr:error-prone DNA polymerase [Acidobacteriota bacterium]
PMIRTHEKREVDLAHLPPDDPNTFEMLRRADTVGVFQVESRAQMASLPRNSPETFYDLVIQVAIIRPGPIVGGMVHPYFERRRGRQEVVYPHPCLEPVLKRTLGVPIFQEQILRMAMEAAGFSGGEAEELRRAMGFKRSVERMEKIEERLRVGMAKRGLSGAAQEEVVRSITSFALYGFPESHAASFALIAYASAYLKCHHPTAFLAALLNAWPMGFYHPASLIKDSQRHGVEVRPVDVNHSSWRCTWEGDSPPGAVRLGLRYVHGLRRGAGARLEAARRIHDFGDLEDLKQRGRLREEELTTLASCGALTSLGLSRREALWQVAWVSKPNAPLFERNSRNSVTGTSFRNGSKRRDKKTNCRNEVPVTEFCSPLPEMTPLEETFADFRGTGATTGVHPMEHLRPELTKRGVLKAEEIGGLTRGIRVEVAGSVIVRQRPGTAKGMLFLTLEDESGMIQAIVTPDLFRRHRRTIIGSPGLIVHGKVEHKDGSTSIRGDRFEPLRLSPTPSHDFR